ncbi:MAG: DsrE family protein [Candidatus Bipolaricaulaceae bacterium]
MDAELLGRIAEDLAGQRQRELLAAGLAAGPDGRAVSGQCGWRRAEVKLQADRLVVLWYSRDPEVADKVCFMYTLNAKRRGWFGEVSLIVWGPSAQLLNCEPSLQASIGQLIEAGVTVQACRACAEAYGVADQLQGLGVEVKYMGQPLSDMLKSGQPVLTF